jgi:hypothetical protein
VTCRATFTTPQNVLNNNTIVINDVTYKLDLVGDYKTPQYFAESILSCINEKLGKKTYTYDANTIDT